MFKEQRKDYGSIESNPIENLDLLQASQPGYGTRSILEVSLNIVNATVGSGVIGLPFALMLSGFALGISISIFVSFLTFLAIYTLILSSQKSEIYSFPSLAKLALGQFGFHMLNLMLFIQSAGCVVSYFILVGDTIPVLLGLYFPQYPILSDRKTVTIVVSLLIIFPLNLSRSIGSLARWSAFSVMLLPVMILTVLIRAPLYAKDHEAPIWTIGPDPIGTMGIMSFAFVCSQVALPNYLSQANSKGWKITSGLSTFLSWFTSITFGAIGYLSFGKDSGSNIFGNFPMDDPVINLGRLALGVSMIFTIPMGFYPARDSIQKTLGFETEKKQPRKIEHYGVTLILFGVFLAFGINVRSLGKVYSMVGGIASSFIAYILPGSIYLATFHPERWFRLSVKDKSVTHLGLDLASVVLIVYGLFVMLYTILKGFF